MENTLRDLGHREARVQGPSHPWKTHQGTWGAGGPGFRVQGSGHRGRGFSVGGPWVRGIAGWGGVGAVTKTRVVSASRGVLTSSDLSHRDPFLTQPPTKKSATH